MKKIKKAALYDPYLDILGGGEKHILSILKVLEDEGYEVAVFWDNDLRGEIKERFNLQFKTLHFQSNIFDQSSPIKKIKKLCNFDILLYVTDGSYFFSSAKKTIVFSMVPDKKLYHMNLVNKLKTINSTFISNSHYTQTWLQKWGIQSRAIYPFVNDVFFEKKITHSKEPIILSVGRFFGHLHSKQHTEIINAFNLFSAIHPEFKLVLIGGLKEEDKAYFQSLKQKIVQEKNNNIIFIPNASFTTLLEYYRRSTVLWHFAGFNVNEKLHPEQVEHLGMTPVEAMACKTIPFAVNKGGPKEIIQDGKNGFLFETVTELIEKTRMLISNKNLINKMQLCAISYAKTNFSYEIFGKKVKEILL